MPFMKDRLKSRRIDMGLTLQEVADTIGVEKPTVQRYESGKIKKIDTVTVEMLAKATGCVPAYLMGWSDSPLISSPTAPFSTTDFPDEEKRLLFHFHSLNSEGRQKLLSYSDDLISSGKYAAESAEA